MKAWPAFPLSPGDLLAGKYRIESLLGQGGMGVVFAATHLQLEQRVAIKLLHGADSDPEMHERFAREARAASRIRSEHVARAIDVGALDSGMPYIVMEYLEGEDLARALRRRGTIPIAEAIDYVLQACEALAEAHVAGIVHRDLKPANVFLAQRADGSITVKLLDFGVSKVSAPGRDGAITTGATILGSPTYMPPEQIRSARDVDARGDLWSIGATLFELLSGVPPFRADTLPDLCVQILGSPAPALGDAAPSVPRALSAIVARCLAKEPADRFADVAELASALGPFAPPHARTSVERIARVVSAAAKKSAAAMTPATLEELQDASTIRSDRCPNGEPPPSSEGAPGSGEMARSIATSRPRTRRDALVGAGVLVAALAAAALASRANAPAPRVVEPSAASSAAPIAVATSVFDASAAAPIAAAPPAPPAPSASPAAPPRPRPAPKRREPPHAPPSSSGTEGFGDRK